MKKSIVKIKLQSRTDFVSTLEEINYKFGEPYWQHDRVFVPRGFDRNKSQPRLILRTIVKDPNKKAEYQIVLRRHYTDKNFDVLNKTIIKDYGEAAHILYQLGYELRHEFSRRREEISMGDTIKIYIDRIDGLQGFYAKLESILDDKDDPNEARADLIETFKVLGVKHLETVDQSYGEIIEANTNREAE